MNLYKVLFRHYSQKDSKEGIITYLLAESDEQVYKWIRSEPKLKNDERIFVSWMYKDNPDNEDEYEEGFKERIISCHGDMYDDKSEVYDLYYGATQYGWELVNEGFYYTNYCILQSFKIDVEDITTT